MEPLQQIEEPWSLDTFLNGRDYFTLNWDGGRLYVEGNAAFTGSSYAPAGAFILAALPHGFGFAWGSSRAQYGEMSGPCLVPYLLLAGLIPSLAAVRWIIREARSVCRIERGCCAACGYNLTGNTSGSCPECGAPVPSSRPT